MKPMRTIAAAIAGIALLVGASACGSSNSSSNSTNDKTINVVAVSNQWGSMAQELGGKHVKVTTILNNTNTDAHDFEPSASDTAKLESAQIAIVNGAGYDDWAEKATKNNKGIVINAAEEGGIKTGQNPHVWFSSQVRIKTADALTAAYEKLQPQNKDDFEKLHEEWQTEENKLDDQITQISQSDADHSYAATESVADYLAEELALKDKTPKGYKQAAANESEPAASDFHEFEQLLKKGDVSMLIVNSQEPSEMGDRLNSAADSGNVPVVDITEQMPSKYTDLHEWLESVVQQIQDAQTKKN
ncbi:ABC transporter substrate-binding protein [Bifidobacterium dolichotidis]|uniref:ABC transporter substrate-binding protein n=1 Tax=Bifidobacterium dolichotidis TaxID=2306976 RepID=A0A430FQC6_9BIFI|nr:zinc ABC transporter substrate-binding protein [Bifidobacterium dolichotidis]RSX55016.1 ABC transporter substrate-binding protein [Bifidobacterium dolichotidis]